MRGETAASWAIGLVFGAMAGFTMLTFGAPVLLLALASLALAFVAARSVALLSGAFMGVGGAWLALVVRAQLACDAFDAAPNQGCEGVGAEPFLVVSASVVLLGLLLGAGLAPARRSAPRDAIGEFEPMSSRPGIGL